MARSSYLQRLSKAIRGLWVPAHIKEMFRRCGALARTLDASIDETVYDSHHFGNAYVDMHRDGLRVRVIRDRGQYFIELKPRGYRGEPFQADMLLDYLENDSGASSQRNLGDLEQQVERFVRDYPLVTAFFRPEGFEVRVAAFEQSLIAQARRNFPGAFPADADSS